MPNTTNYTWVMPTDGGSANAWGTILNDLFEDIDGQMKIVADAGDTKLPKAGGVMTGELDLTIATSPIVAKGSVAGTVTLDCATAHFFTLTCTGAVSLVLDNVPAAKGLGVVVKITNGAAGTFTHPAGTLWAAGAAPTLSAGTDWVGYILTNGETAPVGIAMALAVA
jgi:hypothetical protein